MKIKHCAMTLIFTSVLFASSVNANTNIPKPTRAEDILDKKSSFINIKGIEVRKGTIAAFLKNIDVLNSSETTEASKQEAIAIMRDLAPALVALNINKKVMFLNKTAQNIIQESALKNGDK